MNRYSKPILFLLLILVGIPRFNWGILTPPLVSLIGEKPFDAIQYERYVEYFRGNNFKSQELEGPFSYRPLVPLIASFFPFQANTSI